MNKYHDHNIILILHTENRHQLRILNAPPNRICKYEAIVQLSKVHRLTVLFMCCLQRKLFHTPSLNGYSVLMNMHINNTAKISSRNSPVVPTRENKMYSVGM